MNIVITTSKYIKNLQQENHIMTLLVESITQCLLFGINIGIEFDANKTVLYINGEKKYNVQN